MDREVHLENQTMQAIIQQVLRLPQRLRRERIKQESQTELVRLLAELLLQALKGERADQGEDPLWKR
jgi:hypothetical protein